MKVKDLLKMLNVEAINGITMVIENKHFRWNCYEPEKLYRNIDVCEKEVVDTKFYDNNTMMITYKD